MSVEFVLIMVLTTEEVFIVEHYFRSYGVGRQNGPSLRHFREHCEEQFNKTAPSNKTIQLSPRSSTGRNQSCVNGREQLGARGPSPQTRIMNDFSNRCYSPQSVVYDEQLKHGVSDRSVRRMFKELHLKRRQSFFVSLQQPVFISMFNNLKDRYERCVRREGTHFEHMLYGRIQICMVLTIACYNYILSFLSTFVTCYLCFAAYYMCGVSSHYLFMGQDIAIRYVVKI